MRERNSFVCEACDLQFLSSEKGEWGREWIVRLFVHVCVSASVYVRISLRSIVLSKFSNEKLQFHR